MIGRACDLSASLGAGPVHLKGLKEHGEGVLIRCRAGEGR